VALLFGCFRLECGQSDFSSTFLDCCSLDSDALAWHVANGVSFRYMFGGCSSFNADVFRLECVATDLSNMFERCASFNLDVSGWNISKATNLGEMFFYCKSFNSDVVAHATNLTGMFDGCTCFNSDVLGGIWPMLPTCRNMFRDCKAFDPDDSDWNVSNAPNLSAMFCGRAGTWQMTPRTCFETTVVSIQTFWIQIWPLLQTYCHVSGVAFLSFRHFRANTTT
jgi:surface protein